MNSPMHSYFAELVGNHALAGSSSIFELVQDNARVPAASNGGRRNSKTASSLSKASTRWHSGDSLCDDIAKRGVDQSLPRAPARRKRSQKCGGQSQQQPEMEEIASQSGSSSFESTKKHDSRKTTTTTSLSAALSMTIPSILLDLPYDAARSHHQKSSQPEPTFDICRALDDVTSVCQEDSNSSHQRRNVRKQSSRRQQQQQRRDLSPRPPNPMMNTTRSLQLMMI